MVLCECLEYFSLLFPPSNFASEFVELLGILL
uniref:Uncharacterized protein n=1 Tax=Rhizophora mucronata TaxID=61149 RepID=A0A2P2QSM8_RHIMU